MRLTRIAVASEDPTMSLPQPRFTVDEYLARERAAEERHIYLDGLIIAMDGESAAYADISRNLAGETLAHGDISINLANTIHQQLRGTPCRALTKDTKIRSGPTPKAGAGTRGFFSYPDLFVVCGEPDFHDAFRDVILNPKVIVEVLSPATEAFDRGRKFARYQTWNPTLTDYVLVAQHQPQIDHFQRQADGGWSYHSHTGLDRTCVIASIGCTLRLADVYERVAFPAADEAQP